MNLKKLSIPGALLMFGSTIVTHLVSSKEKVEASSQFLTTILLVIDISLNFILLLTVFLYVLKPDDQSEYK